MASTLSRNSSFLLLLCLGFAPLLPAQNPSASIDSYLATETQVHGFNGRVIVAHADTVLVDKSLGAASVQGNSPAFPIGSIAEEFVAVAALQLEKESKLSLDNALCEYISDCPAAWGKITIRHLLTHSSGLPAVPSASSCLDTQSASSILDLKKKLSGNPLLFQPGSESRYNPANDAFLWWIIQKASGKPASEYLQTHVFRPLGLKQTKLKHSNPGSGACNGAFSSGSGQDSSPCLTLLPEIYSTTQDLYKLQYAFSSHALLPKELTGKIFVAYVEGQGLGFKIIKEFDRKVGIQNSTCGPGSLSIRNYVDDETYVVVWSAHMQSANQISHDIGSILFGKRYPLNSGSSSN
jgi:CubicO group peptidase (beta-lactamase class C family)